LKSLIEDLHMPPSKEHRKHSDSKGVLEILQEIEQVQDQQQQGQSATTPTWLAVQEKLGNRRVSAILSGQSVDPFDLYVRHLLQVEREQGLDTSLYLPWNAPPAWTEWIRPYYGVLSEHYTAQIENGEPGIDSAINPAPGPELLSQDGLEKLATEDAFLVDWFNATLHRAGSGRSAKPQERALMEQVHGPLPDTLKIHEGDAAREAAEGVQAKAFTLGTDIYFSGRADASTGEGAELLVHEATHVKQAVEGRLPSKSGKGLETSSPSDPHELEAYAAGAEGRKLVNKKASWGLDAVGTVEPSGAAVLDQLGMELPEVEGWGRVQAIQQPQLQSALHESPENASNLVNRSQTTVTIDGEEITDERYQALLKSEVEAVARAAGRAADELLVYEIQQQVFNHYQDQGAGWDNFHAAPPAQILVSSLKKASDFTLFHLFGIPEEKTTPTTTSELMDAISDFRHQPEIMLSRLNAMGDRLQMFHNAHKGGSVSEFWVVLITESLGGASLPGGESRSAAFEQVRSFQQILQTGADTTGEDLYLFRLASAYKTAEDQANIYISAGNDYIRRFEGSSENIVGVLEFTKAVSFTVVTAYLSGGQITLVKGAGAVGAVALDNVITQTTEVAVGLRQDFSFGELANVIAKEGLAQAVGGKAGKMLAARLGPHIAGHFAGIIAEGHMPRVAAGVTKILEGTFSAGFKSIFKEVWTVWGEGEDFSTSEFLMKTSVAMLAGGVGSGLDWNARTNSLFRDNPEVLKETVRQIRVSSKLGKVILTEMGSSFLSSDSPVQKKESSAKKTKKAFNPGDGASDLNSARSKLPHADNIQASFGKHDISQIRAGVGGSSGAAAADIGAKAYTSGDKVAFQSGQADLHTSAHEAAHVVQQRSGKVPDGMGESGDRFEQHADAVADKVVAGESAEPLLNEFGGGGSTGSGVQRKSVQRKDGGGGSSHSGALIGLTSGMSATSTAGLGTLGNQTGGKPDLNKQSATEDRASKRDKFETGVDNNLDDIEDHWAFNQLIDSIEDDESTSGDLKYIQRSTAFEQLSKQWQSALDDKKDGAKLRGIFNNEYDGRGFWKETEQAFALVANAAKRAATPDPNAAGADSALAELDGEEEIAPEGKEEQTGQGPNGKKGGAGSGPEAIPEGIAALLDVAVPIEPESLASFETMETLQVDYNNIHSAFGSRETFSEQAEIQANDRGRVGEVFETVAESFGSGFLQGALEGTVDAVVWDTLTSAGDSFIKTQLKGQMPPVIGPAYSLIKSFGLYPGAEFDPTAGIGGKEGDLAKMGETFGGLKSNLSAIASGEYSGTDLIGVVVAAMADALQMVKQVLDLVVKVLGILSALLYVIAGVLIALGLAFCWCGMGFLIPIGNQLIPIGTTLGNFCKLLTPITLGLSIAIPILRAIAAIMVPQEMYAKQLEMTAQTSESLGSSTGSQIADSTVENAKDRIATRNVPVGTTEENPATKKQTEGNVDGKELADEIQAKHDEGVTELDTQNKKVADTSADEPDSAAPKKSIKDDAVDIAKAVLNPKNITESVSKHFAPLKKLKDPDYWNTDLKTVYDKSSAIHEQELGIEARKKVLEDDIKRLENAVGTAEKKIADGVTDLESMKQEIGYTEKAIEQANSEGSGATPEEISHLESVKSFHEAELNEVRKNSEAAEVELQKAQGQIDKGKVEKKKLELETLQSRSTDRSNIDLTDQTKAQGQLETAKTKHESAKLEYEKALSDFETNWKEAQEDGSTISLNADLGKKRAAWKRSEDHLAAVISSPANANYAKGNHPEVKKATAETELKKAELQSAIDAEIKRNLRYLANDEKNLKDLKKDPDASQSDINHLESLISFRQGRKDNPASDDIDRALVKLQKSEETLTSAKSQSDYVEIATRQSTIDGTTNSRNNEKVITNDKGEEIGRRRKKGSGSPSKIIAGMLQEFQGLKYLKTNDGDKLLWAPDTGQESPEELQHLPTLEPALAKVYRGVGSEAFFSMMAEEVPIELDTLAQDRQSAEFHMQRHIALHFDAYMAYQSEREAKATVDSKTQFLSSELQPAGDLIAQQGPELKSAESSAKERQSKLSGVDPEVGKADPAIAGAGKQASKGVKEGEDDMKDKPDSGATNAGAADASGAVDDADSTTKESKEVVSGSSEEEVSMVGEMIGIQSSIQSGHEGNIQGLETKISEDDAGLQEIKLEKATRLNESNIERELANTHAKKYNESTTTLTDWAIKYQGDRDKVHSLTSSA
jgi:hypothetical protein